MTHKAVIVVEGDESLAPVLGLSLLERAILEAGRGGIRDFVLILPPGEEAYTNLLQSLRKRGLRLHILSSDKRSHPLVAAGEVLGEDFLVLTANLLFEAGLIRVLATADGSSLDALLAIPAAETEASEEGFAAAAPVHLWRLTGCGLARLRSAGSNVSIGETLEFLERRGLVRVALYPAATTLCLHLPGRVEARAAEEKLFRAGGEKKTDGIFARFNKRVLARPLIRLFLRLDVGPNSITLGGLWLAILSGLVFALGGSVASLAGAVLFFVSSMLDHCDGVVARLRYRESNFGAWLDSVLDPVSYLAVFAGMTLGLYRETGQQWFVYLGALLLGGVGLSLAADIYQRRKIGGREPHTYLARWEKLADERTSHPAVFAARNLHFLVRRATVPYWILGFTLLGLRPLFLTLTTLGANLFWIFLLGIHRFILPRRESPSELARAPEGIGA